MAAAHLAQQPEPRATASPDGELWPGFNAGDVDAGETERQVEARGMLSSLRAEVARVGDDGLARELDAAVRLAARFRAWAGTRVAPVPEIVDAEEPAPPAWVGRQLPKTLREEASLLAAAIEAESDDEAAGLARRLVRVRFRRVAMSHAVDVARWRREEISDGLALYTSHAVLARGRARGESSRLASMMRARLLHELRGAGPSGTVAFDPELAGFGAALLLDRTRPGWRTLLAERGTSLDVLLAGPPKNFGNRPAGP